MPSLWAFGFRCIFASLWLQANVDRSKSSFSRCRTAAFPPWICRCWLFLSQLIQNPEVDSLRRRSISELSLRDYCLYRAICSELEVLEDSIQIDGQSGGHLLELAVAMRDRRLLVEWLRELGYPPSSDLSDSGITPELEEQLIAHGSDW